MECTAVKCSCLFFFLCLDDTCACGKCLITFGFHAFIVWHLTWLYHCNQAHDVGTYSSVPPLPLQKKKNEMCAHLIRWNFKESKSSERHEFTCLLLSHHIKFLMGKDATHHLAAIFFSFRFDVMPVLVFRPPALNQQNEKTVMFPINHREKQKKKKNFAQILN